MGMMGRLACKLRGHTWEEHTDPAGTMNFCARCGKLRHARPGVDSTTEELEYKAGAAGSPGPPGG